MQLPVLYLPLLCQVGLCGSPPPWCPLAEGQWDVTCLSLGLGALLCQAIYIKTKQGINHCCTELIKTLIKKFQQLCQNGQCLLKLSARGRKVLKI